MLSKLSATAAFRDFLKQHIHADQYFLKVIKNIALTKFSVPIKNYN